MTKHTATPWVIKKVKTSCGYCYKIGSQEIVDKDHSGSVCLYDDNTTFNETPHEEIEANAERIVACVNACEGIETSDLQQGVLLNGLINAMKEQRKELVEALKNALKNIITSREYEAGQAISTEVDNILSVAEVSLKQALKKAGLNV